MKPTWLQPLVVHEEPWESPITNYADRVILQAHIVEAMEKINEVTERLTKYTLTSRSE